MEPNDGLNVRTPQNINRGGALYAACAQCKAHILQGKQGKFQKNEELCEHKGRDPLMLEPTASLLLPLPANASCLFAVPNFVL